MAFQRTEQIDKLITDTTTGEVLLQQSEVKTTTVQIEKKEEQFVKIYYDTYLAAMECNHSDISDILIAIGKRMTYSTEGQIIVLSAPIKEEIAREVNKSIRQIERAVKLLIEKNMLKRVGGPRSGTYYVSPFVLAKGKWNAVQALRLEYSKKNGTLSISGISPAEIEDQNDPKLIEETEKNEP